MTNSNKNVKKYVYIWENMRKRSHHTISSLFTFRHKKVESFRAQNLDYQKFPQKFVTRDVLTFEKV